MLQARSQGQQAVVSLQSSHRQPIVHVNRVKEGRCRLETVSLLQLAKTLQLA